MVNKVVPIPNKVIVQAAVGNERKHAAHFLIRGRLSRRADWAISLLGLLPLLTLWCLLTYTEFVHRSFFPTPTAIVDGLIEFHRRNWLFPAIWRSTTRVVTALLLVIGIGMPIGILIGAFAPFDAFLRKIVNGGKAVPTSALLGLVVLWAGLDDTAKIVFLFLGSIFYMIILVKNAILGVNEEYLRVALDLGANRWQMIWRVLLPGAVPQIW